jgi:dUTP pyrophosphatase
MLDVEVKILDPRLHFWGFPRWGSSWAAGLDLHACLPDKLMLAPQVRSVLIPVGIAIRIGDPEWCGLVVPRSGLGHLKGLVLGNTVGIVDADFDGPLQISVWNRNAPDGDNPAAITIAPGDRVAQLLFTRVTRPQLQLVDSFSARSLRGQGGYGSTGV